MLAPGKTPLDWARARRSSTVLRVVLGMFLGVAMSKPKSTYLTCGPCSSYLGHKNLNA